MRAIVVSCSESKKTSSDLALQLYDGPVFRLLRRNLHSDEWASVWIVSARYGFIDGVSRIEPYDDRLTLAKARGIRPTVTAAIKDRLGRLDATAQVCFCLPHLYRESIDFELLGLPDGRVTHIAGRRGNSLTALKQWITGQNQTPRIRQPKAGLLGAFRRTQAPISFQASWINQARQATSLEAKKGALEVRWFVEVEGIRFPAKRFASALSGLPCREFDTFEALGYLLACGFQVREKP